MWSKISKIKISIQLKSRNWSKICKTNQMTRAKSRLQQTTNGKLPAMARTISSKTATTSIQETISWSIFGVQSILITHRLSKMLLESQPSFQVLPFCIVTCTTSSQTVESQEFSFFPRVTFLSILGQREGMPPSTSSCAEKLLQLKASLSWRKPSNLHTSM